MNPVFEVFAAFVLWAEPERVQAALAPEQVLGTGWADIMQRAGRLLPVGASQLCSGLLSIMLFDEQSWDKSLRRLLETPTTRWREAILPRGISPERLLHVISRPLAAQELLSEMGLGTDPEHADFYASLIAHPRVLRGEVLALLENAWNAGFREWWAKACASSMPAFAALGESERSISNMPGPTPSEACHVTLRPAMLRRGELLISTRSCIMVLKPPGDEDRTLGTGPRTGAAQSTGGSRPRPSADVFRALGDNTRLAILDILSEGPSYPSIIAGKLGISAPTMSHHISVLKAAGLVSVNRAKGFTLVSLDTGTLHDAAAFVKALASAAERKGNDERLTKDTGEQSCGGLREIVPKRGV